MRMKGNSTSSYKNINSLNCPSNDNHIRHQINANRPRTGPVVQLFKPVWMSGQHKLVQFQQMQQAHHEVTRRNAHDLFNENKPRLLEFAFRPKLQTVRKVKVGLFGPGQPQPRPIELLRS